jgi:phage tail P2-like protein
MEGLKMAKDIYGLSLADIIPSSIINDPQILAMISALDPELSGVSHEIREALIYSRIDELSEDIIDLLAWQFHADFYEPVSMDLETKRNVVKSTIMVHRKKGTPWAVRRLLTDLGFQVEYTEWFNFGGQPYVDRLKVWIGDGFDFSLESRNLIELAWNLTKSTRTHLESLGVSLWFLDDFPFIDDGEGREDGIRISTVFRFFDAFPWPGLRYGEFSYGRAIAYGEFSYGDGTRFGDGAPGTRYFGEDAPDILSDFVGRLEPLEEIHEVPAVYGEVKYGEFVYGQSPGVQDYGGDVTIRKPLIYGKFSYGDGIPGYGEFFYGDDTSFGGGVVFGGEITKEAL